MKTLKKAMCLLIVMLIIISATACVPESVKNIAKIDGNKIKKTEFSDYYNVTLMLQEAYGYTLPETEDEIEYYKEVIVEEFVRAKLVELYNNDNGIVSDASVDEAKEELVDLFKVTYTTDEEYEAYVTEWGYTLETFDEALTEFLQLNNALTAFYASGAGIGTVLEDEVALKAGDVEISKEMFNYFAINILLNNYVNGNSYPSSDAELAYYFENIKQYYLAFYAAVYDYGVKNGFELTDEEIQAGYTKFGTIEMLFGEETMSSLYSEYFVNEENVDEFALLSAKMFAMETKISDDLMENYNPTDEELKTYYDNCADTVFGEQVSAYHILTEDENRAKELWEESKGTPEGFMEIYEKYSADDNDDEAIVEAADLGSFYYRAMVAEFSDAAFSMEIGEVKGMVESEFGYHLIYVYDKKEAVTWDENYDEVYDTYLEANRSSYVYNKLDEIYDDCDIEEGNYVKVPNESLGDWLREQYRTKIYYYNLED